MKNKLGWARPAVPTGDLGNVSMAANGTRLPSSKVPDLEDDIKGRSMGRKEVCKVRSTRASVVVQLSQRTDRISSTMSLATSNTERSIIEITGRGIRARKIKQNCLKKSATRLKKFPAILRRICRTDSAAQYK